jgi:hypothetical protein
MIIAAEEIVDYFSPAWIIRDTLDICELRALFRQARLLRREQRDLEQQAKNALNRCLLILKYVWPCTL